MVREMMNRKEIKETLESVRQSKNVVENILLYKDNKIEQKLELNRFVNNLIAKEKSLEAELIVLSEPIVLNNVQGNDT